MNDNTHHEKEIRQILEDETFSRRTAQHVVNRAQKKNNYARYSAAAVALLAASSLLFWPQKTAKNTYAGLSASAVEDVIDESGDTWKDTDTLIEAALLVGNYDLDSAD